MIFWGPLYALGFKDLQFPCPLHTYPKSILFLAESTFHSPPMIIDPNTINNRDCSLWSSPKASRGGLAWPLGLAGRFYVDINETPQYGFVRYCGYSWDLSVCCNTKFYTPKRCCMIIIETPQFFVKLLRQPFTHLCGVVCPELWCGTYYVAHVLLWCVSFMHVCCALLCGMVVVPYCCISCCGVSHICMYVVQGCAPPALCLRIPSCN